MSKNRDLEVVVNCINCRENTRIMVESTSYTKWLQGDIIQTALHYLSVDAREMLMSHICPTCYIELFGSEEEGVDEVEPITDEQSQQAQDIVNNLGCMCNYNSKGERIYACSMHNKEIFYVIEEWAFKKKEKPVEPTPATNQRW